eukprot:94279_1
MSNRRKRKHKSSSKRRRVKSYLEHYETSVNNLIDAFETSLDISPILPNKTTSKIQYQSEQKETETPEYELNASLDTDDIPRIQELQHDAFYDTVTESDCNEMHQTDPPQSNTHDIQSPKQQAIHIESEPEQHISMQQTEPNPSMIHPESLPLPQLPQESVNNQHIQNISDHHHHHAPNTPQLLSQSIHIQPPPQHMAHPLSQSYDVAMHHHPYNHTHHLAWSQPQPQHQYRSPIHAQPQPWIPPNNTSYFAPQQLHFSSHSQSFQHAQIPSMSQSVELPPHTLNGLPPNEDDMEDIEENEDDESLFMPISPTLSGSALRALLSHLRRKCKTLQFKSKQQRKYIINTQHDISDYKAKLSHEKLKLYDQEQNLLMLQNQNDHKSLEYLRGAELHQTRQELNFMMQKMNELEGNTQHLKQQNKLQELDHETYIKSLKDEYQRLLREINQHKVLFDQRGRELEQLKQSTNTEKTHLDATLKERAKVEEETQNTLSTVSEELASLKSNHEELKKEYDAVSAEKDKLSKLMKEMHLTLDEKDQNILSLQRVRDNLEQEINALSRSNRNFREIRNKSTSQLLESQKNEIDAAKHQVAMQYDKYLDEEKRKNEQLERVLKERDAMIEQLHRQDTSCYDDNEYHAALKRLEIENHELRKQLEEVQFGGATRAMQNRSCQTEGMNDATEIDPYHCVPSTAAGSMDEFGILMLNAAKEEIEQLRRTNETLVKLHAKNHYKKPRVQEQCTQTYADNMNQTANSSFLTVDTVGSVSSMQTHKFFDNFDSSPIGNDDHQFEILISSPAKSDKMLINDTITSAGTTVDSSFSKS